MKRKVLTLCDKREIIKSLENGITVTKLAKEYGIAKSTVCSIKKKRQGILDVTEKYAGVSKRKTLKSGDMPIMENELYVWFCKRKSKSLPVSGEILKNKAKSLHRILNEKQHFTASDGWLQKFKKRFGIQFLKKPEKKSPLPSADAFKQNFMLTLKKLNLSHDQVYYANHSELIHKLLPEKSVLKCDEKSSVGKIADEEQFRFLVCANTTGDHKIKLFIVGNASNSNSLGKLLLPMEYKDCKNAVMTLEIFRNWFHTSFVPQVTEFLEQKRLPIKAILLLENSASYLPTEGLKAANGNIIVMHIPSHTSTVIQQENHNVTFLMNPAYRTSLLSSIIFSNFTDISKNIADLSSRDVARNLCLVWDKIETHTIKKCWRSILELIDEPNQDQSILEDNYKLAVNEEPFQVATTVLQHIQQEASSSTEAVGQCIENEVAEIIIKNDNSVEDFKVDPFQELNVKEISSAEAIEAFSKVILWTEKNIINNDEYLSVLRKCREEALQKSLEDVEHKIIPS